MPMLHRSQGRLHQDVGKEGREERDEALEMLDSMRKGNPQRAVELIGSQICMGKPAPEIVFRVGSSAGFELDY